MTGPRYYHLAALLASIGDELADDVEGLDMSSINSVRLPKLAGAIGYIQRAAELVLECEPSPELASEVRALEALCQCGRDRGDHMVEPPYPTEDVACAGYTPRGTP